MTKEIKDFYLAHREPRPPTILHFRLEMMRTTNKLEAEVTTKPPPTPSFQVFMLCVESSSPCHAGTSVTGVAVTAIERTITRPC